MNKRRKTILLLGTTIVMAVLLIYPKAAIAGAADGLELCLKSVIPALLPFFFLSIILSNALQKEKLAFLVPIGKLCGIPRGQESLFLLGLLCGYPVGAQNIYSAYKSNLLTRKAARRMLGFCSNAGPSFIFGITSLLFSGSYIPWVIWGVHILSAFLTGMLLPGKKETVAADKPSSDISLSEALVAALKSLAAVCGWVILFRAVISICDSLFLERLPDVVRVAFCGILELTNGCTALFQIHDEGIRFLLCSAFLSFGGICVWMQTVSVTRELGTGSYLKGKMVQCMISISCAAFLKPLLFRNETSLSKYPWVYLLPVCTVITCVMMNYRKKEVDFSENLLYNSKKEA